MRVLARSGTVPLVAVLAFLALAGCGGSSGRGGTHTVTVSPYGVFPATTVSGSTRPAGTAVCRTDAGTLADDAVGFLDHFGPAAAYPADLNYVIIREDLARFRSHRCESKLLGDALTKRLTPAERRELVADLPASMAHVLRDALARSG